MNLLIPHKRFSEFFAFIQQVVLESFKAKK